MSAAASPITRQTVGKTFIAAISVLGIGALVQLGAIGWIFYSKFQTALPAFSESTGPETIQPNRAFKDPFGDDEAASGLVAADGTPLARPGPASGSGNPAVIPARPIQNGQFTFKPVPINPDATQPSAAPDSRFSELIEQAKALRERGDFSTAVTRFREALAIEPENPMPLAELANTFEKAGAPDKAAEHWRRIYDMGESAGMYFTAAEAKMKASQAQAIMQLNATKTPVTSLMNAPAPPVQTQTSAATTQSVGLFPGSRLGFGDITIREENDPTAIKKMVLRAPVRARTKARIDVADVTIQVIFYDVVNGRTFEKTNAQVSTRWASPPADWADDDVEILEVTYTVSTPPQGEAIEDRKYYGYLARVYYKDALQDARAEPARLGQTYPAPRMLQPDSTP
jgi:tetratricopeptide (TPR) repeat protein